MTSPARLPAALLLAAGLVTAGCSTGQPDAGSEAAPVTATARVAASPFAADGTPAERLTVVEEAEAKCSASGVDLSDPTARRCMTTDGYLVYDPCYVAEPPSRDTALCLRDPDDTDAVRIHLVEDTGPRPPDTAADRPWFLELADGRRCVLAPSPDPADPAEQPTYTCGADDHLFGMPDTSAPVWTIDNGRTDAPATHHAVRVRTAWF